MAGTDSDQDRLNQRAARDYSPAAPEPEPARPPGKPPGQMLREGREAAGWSIDDLSAETMIQPHILDGLEADNYAQLGQPVFVRGYYRKCARMLGLSEEAISQAYSQASGVSPDARPQVTADVTMKTSNALQTELLRYAPTAALVVLVVAIIFIWQQFAGGPDENASPSSGNDAAAGVERLDTADQTPEPLGGNPKLSAGGSPVNPNRSGARVDTAGSIAAGRRSGEAAVQPADDPAANAAAPPVIEEEAPLLRLAFSERSWVKIRDANGRALLNGIMDAETERVIDEGEPPFSVVLGYAPGVDIFFRGRSVSMSRYTNSDNTARLTVGEDGTP
jgi:cytoskeleton protein RodZ